METMDFSKLHNPRVFALPYGKIALKAQCVPHPGVLATTPVMMRPKVGMGSKRVTLLTLPPDQAPEPGRGFNPVYGMAGLTRLPPGVPGRITAKGREFPGLGDDSVAVPVGEKTWFKKDFVEPYMAMAKDSPFLLFSTMTAITLMTLAITKALGRAVGGSAS